MIAKHVHIRLKINILNHASIFSIRFERFPKVNHPDISIHIIIHKQQRCADQLKINVLFSLGRINKSHFLTLWGRYRNFFFREKRIFSYPDIFKLRLGPLIPRSVGRSVSPPKITKKITKL